VKTRERSARVDTTTTVHDLDDDDDDTNGDDDVIIIIIIFSRWGRCVLLPRWTTLSRREIAEKSRVTVDEK
jgi:hypothetical protein